MTINISGPINNLLPLDLDKPLDCFVGLPIIKDGKVAGRIESVNMDTGMFHGMVEEDIESIIPETCSMGIVGDKED